jgi:hypothetical protein
MTVQKKYRLVPLEYDEVSLVDSGAAPDAHVVIFKRSGECGKPNSSTGAKETEESKKSKRAKNFKEGRHPRDEKGRMKQTSSDSKKKYGKGGTTKASLEADCRDKKKSPKRNRVEKKLVAMNTQALLRATLERKASS